MDAIAGPARVGPEAAAGGAESIADEAVAPLGDSATRSGEPVRTTTSSSAAGELPLAERDRLDAADVATIVSVWTAVDEAQSALDRAKRTSAKFGTGPAEPGPAVEEPITQESLRSLLDEIERELVAIAELEERIDRNEGEIARLRRQKYMAVGFVVVLVVLLAIVLIASLS